MLDGMVILDMRNQEEIEKKNCLQKRLKTEQKSKLMYILFYLQKCFSCDCTFLLKMCNM